MILVDKKTKQIVPSKPTSKTAFDLYKAVGKKFPVHDDGNFFEIDDSSLTADEKSKLLVELSK